MDLTEDELEPGLILGRYELLAPVAKGGMAQVWVARLTGTRGFQKTVAIKTMLPNVSDDPKFEEMFLDEASLASRVRHPNAVEIMDLGEDHGILYLVMEWIEGEPLSILMRAAAKKTGIPLPLAVRITMQACAGLHAAHELKDEEGTTMGLVHRDVSPQNILVSYAGVVKVVDFGVAKATGRVSAATGAGQIKGKVPYMSPEQASGGLIDRRTDVFAMGILLYMMTTGKHPFRMENEAQTLLAICSDTPVIAPTSFLPDYPPELEAVLLKTLAKAPADRYQTAADMGRALDGLPAIIRSSTEEGLSELMRSLLAERIEKRKTLLQAALKTADQRADGRKSFVDLMPVEERSSHQITPLSGISGSMVGRAPGMPGSALRASESGEQSASSVTAAVSTPRPPQSRFAPVAGALVLGGLAAFGLHLIVNAPRDDARPPVTAGAPAVPAPALAPAPSAVKVLQVEELQEAEDAVVEITTETNVDSRAEARGARGSKLRAVDPKAMAQPAKKPAGPTATPSGAAAPAKKANKPFISPFAEPDF